MPFIPQFGHSIISMRNITYAQNFFYPMERFFMPRILIKTDGEHDSTCLYFGFRTTLELYHQAAVTVQESGDIRQINLRSTSHGIALLLYHISMIGKEDCISTVDLIKILMKY